MKITRRQLKEIIAESLSSNNIIREQTRTEVPPAVYDRTMQLMDIRDMPYKEALAQAWEDVRRVEPEALEGWTQDDPVAAKEAPRPELEPADSGSRDSYDYRDSSDSKDSSDSSDSSSFGFDEPESWTNDRAAVKGSIEGRWFPKNSKKYLTSSAKGGYNDLVTDDGDGPWYVTPDMGGLDQEHFGRTGWGWWKMTKNGVYYTPKTPGGRVGDWDDSSDPDIGYAPLRLSADLPGGYSIDSFNLDNMYYRWQGETGLGLEGDIKLKGKGPRPDVNQVDKQKNKLTYWGNIRDFLKGIFRSGSASMTLQIDTPLGKVPVTLKAG